MPEPQPASKELKKVVRTLLLRRGPGVPEGELPRRRPWPTEERLRVALSGYVEGSQDRKGRRPASGYLKPGNARKVEWAKRPKCGGELFLAR